MLNRAYLIFFILMVSNIGYSAEIHFDKNALVLIAQNLTKDLPKLKDQVSDDALNYINDAIKLYEDTESYQEEDIPSNLLNSFIFSEQFSDMSISFGNVQIIGYKDGGISINGVKQKVNISSIAELNEALIKNIGFL
jgi:hypothetical protein